MHTQEPTNRSATVPTPSEIATMTPMMRQYFELKARCPDAVLLFRMGDFYEIFASDAEEVAPVLELVLTSRERGDERRVPFCGVPYHSARNYWLKLLRRGYKVALADQLEDAAEAKGLVRRDIVRILTPGCIDDPEGLEPDAPNYLMGLHEDPASGIWSVALADLSTGELRLGELAQGKNATAAITAALPMIERLKPKELYLRRFLHDDALTALKPYQALNRLLLEVLPEGPLRDPEMQTRLLAETLGAGGLSAQPCGGVRGGEALLAALLAHFKSLQAGTRQFLSVRPLVEAQTMVLDETAIRDLELFETMRRRDAQGSLMREINWTLSPMGARLLRYFLTHPLIDTNQIRNRHLAVRALLKGGEAKITEIRQSLKNLPDLERLATRAFSGSAAPVELGKIAQGLTQAAWLRDALLNAEGALRTETRDLGLYTTITVGLGFYREPLAVLAHALDEAPRPLGSGTGVFKRGYDSELDRLADLARSGEAEVETYQEQLRAATGIGSLKIKSHKSFGLLIEVTRTHAAKIPPSFIRRQTMVNCERFTTVELEELSEQLTSAGDLAIAREAELWRALLNELATYSQALNAVAHALATFDLLQSFAWLACKQDYCEPTLVTDGSLELRGSRHPVVERHVGRHAFCPNDVTMTPASKHMLITGPNMAGKSTLMRQTALAAILNQIGSFVPAQKACLPVFDRIFTRVGAADDLARGQSTFMVEMSEAANILRHASPRSLVILDEVGRGTSTCDGLALATAILKELAQRIRCYTLFATHYHELVPLAATLPDVKAVQTEVIEQGDQIIFTHRLKDGACDSSYGLEVARLAGIPDTVLAAARNFLHQHGAPSSLAAKAPRATPNTTTASDDKAEKRQPRTTTGASAAPMERLGYFESRPVTPSPAEAAGAQELLRRITGLNINRMTPMQALNLLADLKNDFCTPPACPMAFDTNL